jgi:iron(III) transport system ATP-binding protein
MILPNPTSLMAGCLARVNRSELLMEIHIKNISKYYYSGGKTIKALDNVNLTIPANRIFTLLGPSGCGKTTLLRCIVGLESPDTGEIEIGGEVVWSSDKNIFVPTENRGLGMVFQTYAIWPHMNVFNNVAYPLQTRKMPRDIIRNKVEKTLRFVQLEGFEDRPATKLSGGQQQRVALARALVAEPKVILFDEPLSNLDAKLREETRKELRTFLTELQITAVYVTHDRIEALALSDIVAVMNKGRIIETGSPRDIYFNANHRFVADFIGRTNLIEAVVTSQEGTVTTVDCAIGSVTCRKQIGMKPGDKVTLCLRPEFIRLKRGDAKKAQNVFNGRIQSLVFIGEAFEGEITVNDSQLFIKIEPDSAIIEEDRANFTVDPEYCLLVTR